MDYVLYVSRSCCLSIVAVTLSRYFCINSLQIKKLKELQSCSSSELNTCESWAHVSFEYHFLHSLIVQEGRKVWARLLAHLQYWGNEDRRGSRHQGCRSPHSRDAMGSWWQNTPTTHSLSGIPRRVYWGPEVSECVGPPPPPTRPSGSLTAHHVSVPGRGRKDSVVCLCQIFQRLLSGCVIGRNWTG